MALVLPYIKLQWTQIVPGDGEEFVRYAIKRDGQYLIEPEVQIATLNDVATVEYRDYLATPYEQHDYEITWFANLSGDVIESEPAQANATLEFAVLAMHDVYDPSRYILIRANDYTLNPTQEQRWRRARGNDAQTVFIGRGYWRDISFNHHVQIMDSTGRARWATIEDLYKDQRDGVVLCVRPGFQGERLVGVLTSIQRQDVPNVYNPTMSFREVNFIETA